MKQIMFLHRHHRELPSGHQEPDSQRSHHWIPPDRHHPTIKKDLVNTIIAKIRRDVAYKS